MTWIHINMAMVSTRRFMRWKKKNLVDMYSHNNQSKIPIKELLEKKNINFFSFFLTKKISKKDPSLQ